MEKTEVQMMLTWDETSIELVSCRCYEVLKWLY